MTDQTSTASASADADVITNAKDPQTLTRTYDADLSVGDGRTIDLRIVPYNEIGIATDPPDFKPYKERFLPGAFDRQMEAAGRVKAFLNFEHEQGIAGIIGHGLQFRDSAASLEGSFRVHKTADGDKALEMVADGFLCGVSMEFAPLRSVRNGDVLDRVRAHVDKVSLCRTGIAAYGGAEVLAVRTTTPIPEEDVVSPLPSDLLARLEKLGVASLDRTRVVRNAWDASPDRFTDEQFVAACLVDRGGDGAVKDRCALPVLEPDGEINVNALTAAASAITPGASPLVKGLNAQMRADIARKLVRYFRLAGETPPAAMVALARQ